MADLPTNGHNPHMPTVHDARLDREGVALCASSQLGKRPRHCGYFARGLICFDFLLLAVYLVLLIKTSTCISGNASTEPGPEQEAGSCYQR
jgi:hypothetical protein